MNKIAVKLFAVVVMVAGIAAATSAHAVWTFNTASTATGAVSSGTAAGVTSVAGYYAGNNASDIVSGNWVTNSGSALTLYSGGGLGMCSDGCTTPNHAIDNKGNTEAVLVGFSSSVILSNVGLGYAVDANGTNSAVDLSLFRWVGAATPTTPALAGLSATSMTGWELVGNYGDLTANGTNAVNTATSGSSWWLISAYNSGFTGAKETRGGLDNGNDYFKLLSLTGYVCATGASCNQPRGTVPEPASLALVGVALVGVYGARRRKPATFSAA